MKRIITCFLLLVVFLSIMGCTKEPNGPDSVQPSGVYDVEKGYSMYPLFTTQEYTEKKSKFDVLTEENEILDSVLESLSTGLIICDENFHILQINKITESYISFSTITSDPKTLEVPVWELIADNEISLFTSIILHLYTKRQDILPFCNHLELYKLTS